MVKYGIIVQKGRFDFKKLIIVGLPAFVLSTPVFWAIIIIICLKGKVDNIIMTIYNFMIIFNIPRLLTVVKIAGRILILHF